MPFDPNAADLVVGLVGTGSMGRGIMQVAAQGGLSVIAFDEKPGAGEAAKDHMAKMLDGQVQKGRLPAAAGRAALDRVSVTDQLSAVAKADVIIEAIIERLDLKQKLFASLDGMTGPDTIIASNTSSIPITAIASACKLPERVCGMHFFNPVPLMRLVEIIPGLKTASWVADALMTLGRRMTREPVLCTDSPAFLVNHVGRAFVPEAQRILSESIASAADIDRILTGAAGFRIGPFSLADLVGIDVQHAVMESIYGLFYNEPAFTPLPDLRTTRRRRPLRPENRRRLVPLRERQENRTPHCPGADATPTIGLAAPEPASSRAASPLARFVGCGRGNTGDRQ